MRSGLLVFLGLVVLFSGALERCKLSDCVSMGWPIVPGAHAAGMPVESLEIVTKAGPQTFQVEVAKTDRQKAVGLMFRRSLPDMTGMLFPYGVPKDLTMWMRNTYIPLDMIFIRADGTIHRVEANTEPFSEEVVAAGAPVTAVLEIGGGEAARLGIAAGDRVIHSHFGAQTR